MLSSYRSTQMHLLPRERDKLYVREIGLLAQTRLARGIRLNETEAIALISAVLQEMARSGKYTVASLMQYGKTLLGYRQVLPGISQTIPEVMIEATFNDGTFLVSVHDPICSPEGNLSLALLGSGLEAPSPDVFPRIFTPEGPVPGRIIALDSAPPITLFPDYRRLSLEMTNTGDRAIQVGSHFPLHKVNRALEFPREVAKGYKLDVAAGTAIRFEPGVKKRVTVVETGPTYRRRIKAGDSEILPGPEPFSLSRAAYASLYGPTTGDRVLLGDTNLWAVVEKDHTSYGDESTFGGGKVLRDGMGQSPGRASSDVLDTVVTNALIVDYSGIIKADIGIKNGLIAGIGKAGNPDTMTYVTQNMIIGSCTEVIAGENLIVTAGGVETHTHFLSMDMCIEGLASGLTTLVGGGTGPAAGSRATTCTPGPWHIRKMLQATDTLPVNVLLTGKGNDSGELPLREQIEAGCGGLKLHEDWGATLEAIDTCLRVCGEYDVQCTIHTDSLNESGFVEDTLKAIGGRTIHTYHSEGAGGGHAPDVIRVCGEPNILPASTNPTQPYASNTIEEHMDMLMVCHHLSRNIAEDVAFADSRIRAETIAAEDVLHDIGAISIMSSDSQAMGRIGEVISRTWRVADKMKEMRGPLISSHGKDSLTNDNARIRRYVAKYTINPAIAHGISQHVGSVEVGKIADLVLYRPKHFGVRPENIIKGGQLVMSNTGDSNGSIPTVQPVYLRPTFGFQPVCAADNSAAFVSMASIRNVGKYGLRKRCLPVSGCTGLGKKDMKLNCETPKISVDPETYVRK